MEFLKEQPGKLWDIIIVDPPAFAKNISKKHKAVIAYKRLNALALKKVKPGPNQNHNFVFPLCY